MTTRPVITLDKRGGMAMDIPIKKDLDAIVAKIALLLPDAKVYLFGSFASGTQRDDSDIDLCVVAPSLKGEQIGTMTSIRLAIMDATELPVDVLAFEAGAFEDRAKLRSTIQHTIANKGVLLNG